jgi:hypothetical protein
MTFNYEITNDQETYSSLSAARGSRRESAVAQLFSLGHINMKTKCIVLLTFLASYCLYGQSLLPVIVLTSRDVFTNSVHLRTPPTTPWQNVTFRYVGKSSTEVEAIVKSRPRCVRIMKDGVVVVETDGGCTGYTDHKTNWVGLVLLFSKYDQAKLAAKTLRGE